MRATNADFAIVAHTKKFVKEKYNYLIINFLIFKKFVSP